MDKTKLEESMDFFRENLKHDKKYFRTWETMISLYMKETYCEWKVNNKGKIPSNNDINKILEQGAKNFLIFWMS